MLTTIAVLCYFLEAQGEVHSVLSLIHPLKTLHGCIPLKQMESFLKDISPSEPDLTPDPQFKWTTSQHDENMRNDRIPSPLVRDLAESIPKGQDGIDIAEFETYESLGKEADV